MSEKTVETFEINENGSTPPSITNLASGCGRPGGFLWGSSGKSGCSC